MTYITNTRSWVDVEGRIGMPNFKRETIIWRGDGEDVYLVGFEKANRKAGKANVDYIDWSNPTKWALEALEDAGVLLDSNHVESEVPTEPVDDDVEDDA